MAIELREKNCGNCEFMVSHGNGSRRFKCNALPHAPSEWWDGLPEEHWCGVYYKAASEPRVKSVPVAKPTSQKNTN